VGKVVDYRKAIIGALLGGVAAVVSASAAGGSSWQALVVVFAAGAVGVGVPVGAVRNGRKAAA
jgi:hypothetical protein